MLHFIEEEEFVCQSAIEILEDFKDKRFKG